MNLKCNLKSKAPKAFPAHLSPRKRGSRTLIRFFVFALLFSCLSGLPAEAAAKKEKPLKAPKYPRKSVWINSNPLSPKNFKGKTTLVYFWDYTSINCIREMDTLKNWYEVYHPYGFEMVWIHAPEFDFAKQKENVENAIKRLQITSPVVLDNDFKLWDAYKVRSWPTKILVNSQGVVEHTRAGEGHYRDTEKNIRKALKLLNPEVVLPETVFRKEPYNFSLKRCGPMTAETYVGSKRSNWWGGSIANDQWVNDDKATFFKDRGQRVERGFFLHGMWESHGDDFEHARQTDELTDYLGLVYLANEVYAMMRPKDKTAESRIYVTRDESPVPAEQRGVDLHVDEEGGTYFVMEEPRLYYLIQDEDEEPHELRLWTRAAGVSVHSFSFSNTCLSEFEHH